MEEGSWFPKALSPLKWGRQHNLDHGCWDIGQRLVYMTVDKGAENQNTDQRQI